VPFLLNCGFRSPARAGCPLAAPSLRVLLREVPGEGCEGVALSGVELAQLARVGGWRERWLRHPVARHPEILDALRRCTPCPDSCDIEFAWDRAVICNFEERWAQVFYPESRRDGITGARFQAGFRNLVGRFFPLFGGVLLHAAAVVLGERAALFVAPDGGGKTTLVRGLASAQVLSDDHVVLRADGQWGEVYSTPFGTITSGPSSARLGAVFLLRKADRVEIRPITLKRAMSSLTDGLHASWVACPSPVRREAFEVLVGAIHGVPVFEFKVTKGFSNWELVHGCLEQEKTRPHGDEGDIEIPALQGLVDTPREDA